jgi:hypothetical protein
MWVYLVFGFVAWIAVGAILFKRRFSRLADSRPGESFESFCASFAADDVPPEVLKVVYTKFQEWTSIADFPVRATDATDQVFWIADEDFEELVLEAVTAAGRKLPPDELFSEPLLLPTVRDVVLFVAWCPKAETVEAG